MSTASRLTISSLGTAPGPIPAARLVSDDERPVLVATTGRERVALPLVVAERVALRLGAPPRALAVLEPMPVYGRPDVDAAARELARAEAVYDRLRDEVTREVGAPWPTQVALGPIAPTTAAIAAERRARVVVMEIDHRTEDRARDDGGEVEAALQVLRCGATPVLAAGPDADGIFRRAAVGVDFSPASTRAAALALRLLAPGGMLSLVHVEPRLELSEPAWDAWDTRARPLVRALLQRLAVELPNASPLADGPRTDRRDVMIGCVTLVGDPATELIEYAERVGADLVAVGAHGAEPATATYLGNVTANVVGLTRKRLPAASVIACRAG
jgi:nucleotide-binding universal stress UspA family protein